MSTTLGPKHVPLLLVKLNVLRYVPCWKRFHNRHFRRHHQHDATPGASGANVSRSTKDATALATSEHRSFAAVGLDSELLVRPLLELLHGERIRLFPAYHKSHDLGVFSGVLLDVAELEYLVCSIASTTKDSVYSYNPNMGHSRVTKRRVSFKEIVN